ncbi:MAG TPA: AraC family transcriptional regulator [Allosphingosinicella sp.]|nr:AraC family transcriptional regulator [Allosphingosinicella sp.]
MSSEAEPWGTLGPPSPDAPPGRLVRQTRTGVAAFRHAFYESGAVVPAHRHGCASLVYGVGGPCHETRPPGGGGGPGIVKRRLTFHPRGYEHSVRFGGPCHVVAIEFEVAAFPVGAGKCWPSRSTVLPATLYNHVWSAMLRVADDRPAEAVAEALTGLIGGAAGFVARRKPGWLLDVIEHIHGNWQNIQSVNALASDFGVSPQHLCRAFKALLGVTIGQYSLLLRLDYARGLLWGTGHSISQIAAETGFSDQSHLTRTLARHSERTPSRMRWKSAVAKQGIAVSDIR